MKLALLLSAFASAGASGPFGVKPSYVKQPPKHTTATSPSLSKALGVRGGHHCVPFFEAFTKGTLKEKLAATFTAFTGVHGIISTGAAEKVPEIFYQGTFDVEEGSLAEVYQEHCGSALAGVALLAYLSAFTDMPVTSAIAWSSMPCFYSHGRRVLKTGYKKFGFSEEFDTFWKLQMLVFPLMSYAIISGKYDSELLAKIYAGMPAVLGLLGRIFPDATNSALGLSDVDDVAKAMGNWWNSSLVFYGILAFSLLTGSDALVAIGRTALVFGLSVIDVNYISKVNEPLNLGLCKAIFPLIMLVIGAGLLKAD